MPRRLSHPPKLRPASLGPFIHKIDTLSAGFYIKVYLIFRILLRATNCQDPAFLKTFLDPPTEPTLALVKMAAPPEITLKNINGKYSLVSHRIILRHVYSEAGIPLSRPADPPGGPAGGSGKRVEVC